MADFCRLYTPFYFSLIFAHTAGTKIFLPACAENIEVNRMKLTKKELEIMAVLWDKKAPMTATEIIGASVNRTWKEDSIYIMMKILIRKGAVVLTGHKPTFSNTARTYKSIITSEEYAAQSILILRKSGIHIDTRIFIECLAKMEGAIVHGDCLS